MSACAGVAARSVAAAGPMQIDDIISYHDYQADTEAMPGGLTAALTIGAELSKPVIVGEAGMNASQLSPCRSRDDRVTLTLAKVRAAFASGVSAFVLWAWAQGGPAPALPRPRGRPR